MMGVDTGIQHSSTPMHLYEPGSEQWINIAGYPQVPRYTQWQLDADGGLAPSGKGRLGSETLVWDEPSRPGARLDFTTPPLTNGATLSGPISATIYARSTNSNLQLIARLQDVAPDGKATPIAFGAMLGSLRELDTGKSWRDSRGVATWPWQKLERDVPLTPGKAYRFDIQLAPRQWGVAPGHRLRLEMTTQSPLDVCPKQGLPTKPGAEVCGLTAPQQKTVPGATYTILRGPKWPSALNLPQLPWKAFNGVPSAVLPTGWWENQRRLRDPAKGDRMFSLPLDWGKAR